MQLTICTEVEGMKKDNSKLVLRKMTVRALSSNELDSVAGGLQTQAPGAVTCTRGNEGTRCVTL